MNHGAPAYGLWVSVLINSAVFLIFAFSFTKPRSAHDWRSFGAFAAFLVALFTEMYGFPLTIYLLAGWLGKRYPELDLLSHDTGHLWNTLLGWRGDAHFSLLHILSSLLIGGGFLLLATAWRVLYEAQRTPTLAVTGPYAYIRHPQYAGFILIMLGFLLQWPTLPTLLMFPILVVMYVRLVHREEREVLAEFGAVYARYAAATPPFFPRLRRLCGGRHKARRRTGAVRMKTSTKRRCPWIFLGLLLLWGWHGGVLAAWAQPTAEQPLELSSLVREALTHNPDIQAARQRWEAAKAFIPQVKTLPDPMLNFGYEKVLEREWRYGVSQEFPFPGKLWLRGEVAAREAERMEQEYLAVPLRVIARLKEAFYDLALVQTSLEIVGRNRLVLVDFERTAQARYAVGRGVQQDVFRAQTEISRLLARLAILEQRQASLRADINRLLNRPPADPLGRPLPLQVTALHRSLADLNALVDAAPLLQAQVKGVERGDHTIALARREYLPDFAVDVAGVHNDTMGKDGYEVMLGIKVPLYYATRQRAGVREALAGREAATQELQAVRQELLFRLTDNFVQAQRAEQLMVILRHAIIPQARLTLESAQAGYAVGTVDFLTLLSSLMTLQENELELHAEITEHEKALARIEEIIGGVP